MAISPLKQPFLQQTSERRTQRNISNFRLRTGQKFSDIARGKLFEQDLISEQIEKQQQARTALAFRSQEESQALEEKRLAESKRQEERRLAESRRQFDVQISRQRKAEKEKKRDELNKTLFGPFAPIASAIT